MISIKQAKKHCSEDISLIQNYDIAVADKTQTWHCHHKLEAWFTAEELKDIGRYKHVPARELVFLTCKEHKKWPHKGIREAADKNRGKPSWNSGMQFRDDYVKQCIYAQKIRKEIAAYYSDGTFMKKFPSISNAAKELHIERANIRLVLDGRRKSTSGYIFKLVK